MPKILHPDGPSVAEPCRLAARDEGIEATTDSGAVLRIPWVGLSGRPEGFEDAWLVLESSEAPGLRLWVEPNWVRAVLGQDQLPEEARRALFQASGERQRRGRKRIVLRSAGLAALAVLGIWVLRGGLTDIVLAAIPPSLESAIGDGAAEQHEAVFCEDEALTAEVDALLESLVATLEPAPPYEFRVRIVRDPSVNAFALPGGQLFVHSGLLEAAGDIDEVAAVMGHEVQHVLLRHGMRGVVRAAGFTFALSAILGDAAESVVLLTQTAANLTQLKFGRDQEREADIGGMKMMAAAGYDPAAAPRFFGTLAEETGDDGGTLARTAALASSHPASTERMERLRALVGRVGRGDEATRPADWSSLRTRCAADGTAP